MHSAELERRNKFDHLDQDWDLIVIGGGITGAAIYNLAAGMGAKVLLVEARDFSWGTSSRSSKLIHGGFRYLKHGKVFLTREAIKERERILKSFQQFASPMKFYFPIYSDAKPSRSYFKLGLMIYDTLSGKRYHKFLDQNVSKHLFPEIKLDHFQGGFTFHDGVTDDSNLVLGLLNSVSGQNALKLNYTKVIDFLKTSGRVSGVCVQDELDPSTTFEIRAKSVINAAGIWSDGLRQKLGKSEILRPLKGSHINLPSWRLNLTQSMTMFHPRDRRPVYIVPWKNVLMVGTSDLDFNKDYKEATISQDEIDYFLEAVNYQFPLVNISYDDIMSTFSGVRPVFDSGAKNPSAESRDEILETEDGLITATGGKLTTHRLTAINALKAAAQNVPALRGISRKQETTLRSDSGYGYQDALINQQISPNGNLAKYKSMMAQQNSNLKYPFQSDFIRDTSLTWAQLSEYAKDKTIVHLDDLLLRRTRLGLLLTHGGKDIMPKVKLICSDHLKWSDQRWQDEVNRYQDIWRQHYSRPES